MSEAIPPADDAGHSEFQENYWRTQKLLLWYGFAEKYLYPKEDSVVALAGRLKIWQAVESRNPGLEKDLLPYYQKVAQQIKDQVIQACLEPDTSFLRRLWDAAVLAAEGKISQSLDVTAAAVYAFRQLCDELGHCPNYNQVKERVEQWRKEGGIENPKISDRQWGRVLKDIKPLFSQWRKLDLSGRQVIDGKMSDI